VWSEQVSQLEGESASQRDRAAQMQESLTVAQQQVEEAHKELIELERTITEVENTQNSLRGQSDSSSGELRKHEIKLAENRQRAEFLVEEVNREFQTEIGAIDWKMLLWRSGDEPEGLQPLDLDDDDDDASPIEEAPPTTEEAAPEVGENLEVTGEEETEAPAQVEAKEAEPAPTKRRKKKKEPRGEPTEADLLGLDDTNWTEIKAEVDALRKRLNGMGAVNLVAIEEYAELKERHDFLKTQCDDLTSARSELLSAIDEINTTSQKQFEVTFEQIKKNFEYTFQTLFGGGKATLELIEAEDVLESGIEIIAQPPGTKLKSISLLSGGQKTLTAVGLLFALYMVKPSPFCLLDELDAPLDESNIGRFTNLLKQFVAESQFIIITHNKRTVAAASAIYGVTMEERGVSKTVSMRFSHNEGNAELQSQNIAEAVNETQN